MDVLLPPQNPADLVSWVLSPTGLFVASVLVVALVVVEGYLAWRRIRIIREQHTPSRTPKILHAAE